MNTREGSKRWCNETQIFLNYATAPDLRDFLELTDDLIAFLQQLRVAQPLPQVLMHCQTAQQQQQQRQTELHSSSSSSSIRHYYYLYTTVDWIPTCVVQHFEQVPSDVGNGARTYVWCSISNRWPLT